MGTVREVLAEAAGILAGAGVSNADREAGWLLAHVLGTSVGGLRARGSMAVTDGDLAEYRRFVHRRAAREPLQYILGTEEFMGFVFHVTPAVLIPRLDTETLVTQAVGLVPSGARVADVGTGSGAIAVSMMRLLPGASAVATDISPEAIAVARRNAEQNGVSGRIDFRCGDLLEPLSGERFDAILSNPPYIAEDEVAGLMPEVREWEPELALTPGPDGLSIFRRLLAGAPSCLKEGGILGVEVGAGQALEVSMLFERAGFQPAVCRDTAGIERAVFGRRA